MSLSLAQIHSSCNSRSPIEIALCAVQRIPQHFLDFIKEGYDINYSLLSEGAKVWFQEEEVSYALIGDWLACWRLGMTEPKGERAALLSATASVFHCFFDLCFALHRLSNEYCLSNQYAKIFNKEGGELYLACSALFSDFFARVNDSGVGYELQLPGFSPPIVEGKSEGYRKSITALRSLGVAPGNRSKARKGRPKKIQPQTYPKACLFFQQVIKDAELVAKRRREFREGAWRNYLEAVSKEVTFCENNSSFQVGFVSKGVLRVGGKGTRIKEVEKKNQESCKR